MKEDNDPTRGPSEEMLAAIKERMDRAWTSAASKRLNAIMGRGTAPTNPAGMPPEGKQ